MAAKDQLRHGYGPREATVEAVTVGSGVAAMEGVPATAAAYAHAGRVIAGALLRMGPIGRFVAACLSGGATTQLLTPRTVRTAEEGVCFAAGTPIHTLDGLKPIEEVRKGEWVWAQDEATGDIVARRVVRTFVTPERPTFEIMLQDAKAHVDRLRATAEHPFWTQRGWVAARQLSPSDRILERSGEWSRVLDVQETGQSATVYNFEVELSHTYFVGEQGVLVHNNCGAVLFENQLAGRLSSEVAAAARVGATPIRMGTAAAETAMNSGTVKWVVTQGGELVISPHTVNGVEISHAVLSGGGPVLAAGQAEIAGVGGGLVGLGITNHSGHFMPSLESVQIGISAFAKYGIKF